MAIPNNYIDKITNKDTGESRIISPAADKVRVENENFEGADLDEVLDEVAQAIEDAGSGDGTVTGVKMNNGQPITPDENGVVDLGTVITDVSNKVDKVTGYGLSKNDYTDTDKTKLAGIEPGAEVNVISGIKANGASTTLPVDQNGVVELPPAGSTISPATAAPLEDGTAGVGSSDKYAREDHVHPHDTSKQDVLTSSTTLMTINGNAVHYGDSVTVQGEKGDKGDTGNVQVDGNGNVLIYNGRDKTTTGAALDASQGQFIGKLLNAKDSTFYNVWVGTAAELEALDGDYEDNTIYLVGTVATVAQRFNVSFNGGDHTSIPASTPETVKEGSAFSVVVSPASGYTIDSCVATMGNSTIQGIPMTGADSGKYSITINNVTGAISIQAAASIHIIGITVSAGTRTNNSIPLSAVVAPSGAENVTLAWSVDDTTNFGISGSGTSATLTVKSGASNASVTITCQDTNASSGTAIGTLLLTGLSYAEAPITEITDISATRTAANTLTLEATADSSTPIIEYSLVGTVPTVKQVRRWAAGDTVDGEVKESAGNDLIELPAVVLSGSTGSTLSYKGDCQVTVRATAGNVTHDETIDIVHDKADAIWFEDPVAVTLLNAKSIGSNGKVTYTQAASPTTFRINGSHVFAGNTSIRRFKEFMYFTSIESLGAYATSFKGCSNLECIGIPAKTLGVTANLAADHPFNGCKLKEVHIKSLADFKLAMSSTYSGMCYAGRNSEGMGLFINGQEVRDIVIPEGLAVTAKYSGFRFTSFTAEHITSYPVGSLYGCTSLVSLKIGNDVTTIGEKAFGADGYAPTNLQNVDLGSGISALGAQCFRGCTGLKSLTLRYNGKVTHSNSFINATSALAAIKLYVPSGQVDTYKADTSYWNTVNDNNIIAITE